MGWVAVQQSAPDDMNSIHIGMVQAVGGDMVTWDKGVVVHARRRGCCDFCSLSACLIPSSADCATPDSANRTLQPWLVYIPTNVVRSACGEKLSSSRIAAEHRERESFRLSDAVVLA